MHKHKHKVPYTLVTKGDKGSGVFSTLNVRQKNQW
jgi:hypothetical protein